MYNKLQAPAMVHQAAVVPSRIAMCTDLLQLHEHIQLCPLQGFPTVLSLEHTNVIHCYLPEGLPLNTTSLKRWSLTN